MSKYGSSVLVITLSIDVQKRKKSGPRPFLNAPDKFKNKVMERTVEVQTTTEQLQREINQRKKIEKSLRQALDEAQQHRAEMSALFDSLSAVLEHREFKDIAQVALDSCRNLLGAASGFIALATEGNEPVCVVLEPGKHSGPVDPVLPFLIDKLGEDVYHTGKTLYENDFPHCKWAQFLPEGHMVIENVLFVPLAIDGKVVGLLSLANKPGGFTDNDARLALALSENAAIALHNSRLLESLKNSETRFRSVAQCANDAIFSADINGHIIFWNNAAESIYGYSAAEITGQPLTLIIPERFQEACQDEITQVLAGNPNVVGKMLDKVGRRKDGTEFPTEISLSTWQAGGEIYLTGIIRDITERKRTEDELQRTINELQLTQNVLREKDKLAIIGQMAAGVAHEIRNPLTGVRGFSQLLREKCTNDHTLAGYTELIVGEIDRANSVISDFLQLAHPKKPVLERQSVNSLIEELLAIARPQALIKNIKIIYEGKRDLPHCLLDRGQMKQALSNIYRNAMEAMPGGGVLKIESGFLAAGNEVYIDICDTGSGIPQDRLEKIGVPFYTTKDEGTGLSLSISYAIINAHQGRIDLDSTEGKGTRFRIYLPC